MLLLLILKSVQVCIILFLLNSLPNPDDELGFDFDNDDPFDDQRMAEKALAEKMINTLLKHWNA